MSGVLVRDGRRLSPWRLLLALAGLGGVVAASLFGYRAWSETIVASGSADPWFAGYVDVTATPTFDLAALSGSAKNPVLGFVVASADDACTPSWGAVHSLDDAATSLDLDRRIALLRERGGDVEVSFGGQANDELASVCTDPAKLQAAYAAVIDRYDVSTIDLDVEGAQLTDAAAAARRATAVAALQAQARAAGRDLAVWLTLPVGPGGLDQGGTDQVAAMLAAGVDLSGVNAMTMNFGAGMPDGGTVLSAATSALSGLHRQLDALYRASGTRLSSATLWRKVGATPMIGQNDVAGEVLSLSDAAALNGFAQKNGVGRLSMWSLNRDRTCSANYVDTGVASDSCSGVDQGDATFADVLSAGFTGRPSASAGTVTTPEPVDTAALVDDPATSPYPVWSPDGAYSAGTKIVWHHAVYRAKWWTQGDVPDDPVLQEWETPWVLIGPVLPGETPVPVPTLPPGTYPDWDGQTIYNAGDRVLFEGTPFEAKWWTQGDSPAAAAADSASSPWRALDVSKIQAKLGAS